MPVDGLDWVSFGGDQRPSLWKLDKKLREVLELESLKLLSRQELKCPSRDPHG